MNSTWIHGSDLRARAAKLRHEYSRRFGVHEDLVTVEYFRHADGRDDARVVGPKDHYERKGRDFVWTVNVCNAKGCCA